MAARRKYIERINNDYYAMDFFTFNGGLYVDFDDKNEPDHGCFYSFSQTEKDWVSAIKLVNLIKRQMEKEAHDRPPAE